MSVEGSLADVTDRQPHVRLTLESRLQTSRSPCRPSGIRLRRPTNPCVTRRANHASGWSSTLHKNIPLLFSPQIGDYIPDVPKTATLVF
jgi:hypothetical protein